MTKYIMYKLIFLLLILISCKNEKLVCNSESLLITNKATGFFGGYREILLEEANDIEDMCSKLNKMTINKKAIISDHTGYVEVSGKNSKSTIFAIVFTKRFGQIIKYNGDYYQNDILVELVAEHLKMDYNRIKSTGKVLIY